MAGREGNTPGGMPRLNLPQAKLRLTSDGGTIKVYDPLRRKDVTLTPEEFVRQHFVAWLTDSLHYPMQLMANEVGLTVNGAHRRSDTVVYNPDGSILMVIEYKAPSIAISQDVFDQIARYNMTLKARYLVVSNGINHYCCAIDYSTMTYSFIPTIPDYLELRSEHSDN